MTTRAKSEMACAVLDNNQSVAAVAAAYGCTWKTCQDAVAATANPVLATESEPVRVSASTRFAGQSEIRDVPKDRETGLGRSVRHWAGRRRRAGGLLVQVNGRSAAPVMTGWPNATRRGASRSPTWRSICR